MSANGHAEGFSLDSINKGLSKASEATESAGKSLDAASKTVEAGQKTATQTIQSGQQTVETVTDQADDLTQTLIKQLGVTKQQAQGGAGAIFQAAKNQLDAEQFASLTEAVPGMDTLLSAAPKQSESLSGLAGSVSNLLGDENNTFGNLAGLASSFKQLDLSPDMVDEFVPAVVDYVRNKGGAMTADMLQSALYGN